MVPHRNIIPAAKAEKAAGEEDAAQVDPVVMVAPEVIADLAAVMLVQAAAADIAVIVVDRAVTAAAAAAERSRQSQSGPVKLN